MVSWGEGAGGGRAAREGVDALAETLYLGCVLLELFGECLVRLLDLRTEIRTKIRRHTG